MSGAERVRGWASAFLAALAGFFRGAMGLSAPRAAEDGRREGESSGKVPERCAATGPWDHFEEPWRGGGPTRCC